jgi:CRP-like cAMP-binding protein
MGAETVKSFKELMRAGKWFRGLPEGLQQALIDASTSRVMPSGTRLFSRGDPPSGLYCVLDGAVRITATTHEGKEALLTLAEPPGWFGEISLFDAQPRTHDAITFGETRLAFVPQTALDAILEREPVYWRSFGLLLTNKLRLALVVLEDTAVLPLGVRLARRLVAMVEGYGEWHDRKMRVLDVKQEQLASMLSTSRQTVNQLLKELASKGTIRLSYGKVEVIDLDALYAEAHAARI